MATLGYAAFREPVNASELKVFRRSTPSFGCGDHARSVPERISRPSDPFFDFGNLTYSTGSGKNRKVPHWGYIAVKLERMLPQIILDAKSNNFLGTNLPASFSRSQVLSLEGNFGRCFTLYCPKEYEQDALYVFTPDLMARLIDDAAGSDIELVDGWMFFYSSRQFEFTHPQTIAPMFWITDRVGAKTTSRSTHYADDRAANGPLSEGSASLTSARMAGNIVSPQRLRLKKRFPVARALLAIGIGIIATGAILGIMIILV